jgi:hypothetical protein
MNTKRPQMNKKITKSILKLSTGCGEVTVPILWLSSPANPTKFCLPLQVDITFEINQNNKN